MIAERDNVDMDEASSRLRTYARNNNHHPTEVAETIVAASIAVDSITPQGRPPRPPSTR